MIFGPVTVLTDTRGIMEESNRDCHNSEGLSRKASIEESSSKRVSPVAGASASMFCTIDASLNAVSCTRSFEFGVASEDMTVRLFSSLAAVENVEIVSAGEGNSRKSVEMLKLHP